GEREGDLTLPMAVDILLLDLHLDTVAQHALDHRGNLRRRAAFQLRVDAGRFLFNVPVDHDPRPAIANVPLGHQILVPGAELFGIGRTGGGAFAPDVGQRVWRMALTTTTMAARRCS